METKIKLDRLIRMFTATDKVLVAFSGGVDSTFLLFILAKYTDANVEAITIKTPYIPQWEVDEATSFTQEYGIKHKILDLPFPKSIITNPGDRCYRCKKTLFSQINEYAEKGKFTIVADGSNADDTGEYRPGMKALGELNIKSPLLEAGFVKSEIRKMLKDNDLEIWNKPAYACLLTRIPHDTMVDERMLYIIEMAELFIKEQGYPGTRVRLHDNIARIECSPDYIESLCRKKNRDKISEYLKNLGIKYVTIDLEGYRTGSLNIT